MSDIASPGALTGIRVADFSRVLAGPYATMMLADFGADVIKIESPAGDDTRSWTPPVDADGQSTYFGAVNRNKRSVICDLRTEEGLARARAIAETLAPGNNVSAVRRSFSSFGQSRGLRSARTGAAVKTSNVRG